ncbi:MAG: DUF3386 family protein [Planctomycetaceae bacterium]|jgi:hypothetical protein|nr:DUF3386 family protein [Planctomycetaceae bacterium]MBT6157958.1 DUF3386 family protein [Planctomycetaceae bacterium]MBT6487484.1 DUF3386 family protein [Planctomycetaceae bacterium]MBT6495079.1 DUF3386 family protein [Planctomycetaceae bacterium]
MRRHAISYVLFVGLIAAIHANTASAHFLFLRIGTHAEAGRSAEVYFSEYAHAGDARFVEKIKPTKLDIQETPGKFQPLVVKAGTDRLRAFLPSSGSVSVGGELVYGVLKRDVSFLLRYHPKGVAGNPEKLNAMSPRKGAPLEIVASWSEKGVTLTALRDGKPVPGALFTTVDSDLVNEELKADKSGHVTWKPDAAGQYCIYTRATTKQRGEHGGKSYTEIRDFATLCFRWPLVRSSADEKAVALFEAAIAKRAVWKNLPGFTADVSGSVDGRGFEGTARVDAEGDLTVESDEEAGTEWVEDQLGSIVLHRQASDGSRPKPVLRFADDDLDHPLGRLLIFDGGRFASSYRVRDGHLSVVNRNIGPMNMTITVLDNKKNAEGKFLPHSYVVQYWDAKTGRLLRTETVQVRWRRVGDFDLPTEQTVTTASESGLTVRTIRLANHKLLSK